MYAHLEVERRKRQRCPPSLIFPTGVEPTNRNSEVEEEFSKTGT
jgi:hypothetical protein